MSYFHYLRRLRHEIRADIEQLELNIDYLASQSTAEDPGRGPAAPLGLTPVRASPHGEGES